MLDFGIKEHFEENLGTETLKLAFFRRRYSDYLINSWYIWKRRIGSSNYVHNGSELISASLNLQFRGTSQSKDIFAEKIVGWIYQQCTSSLRPARLVSLGTDCINFPLLRKICYSSIWHETLRPRKWTVKSIYWNSSNILQFSYSRATYAIMYFQ